MAAGHVAPVREGAAEPACFGVLPRLGYVVDVGLRRVPLHERAHHRAVPRSSTALHETLGYELIGMLREVGRKFNRWIDTRWYQPHFEP